MKNFQCQGCGQLLFFENTKCENCGRALGYLAESETISALEPDNADWRALADNGLYRYCANAEWGVCNWLIASSLPDLYCRACRHNRVVPDLTWEENVRRWRELENAKHRLFYGLMRLRLPLANREDDPEHGLMFAFLADDETTDEPKVLTGHENGLVTLALKEADSVVRVSTMKEMGETYRTLLGHFRHEVGHYFWDVLVRDAGRLEDFRALFGDEQADYREALQRHYQLGPVPQWQDRFISAYASAHPWEDFAETWSHYLHIVDTLDTAAAMGLRLAPREDPNLRARIAFDPYTAKTIEPLVDSWLPLTIAVNNLNRSMGQPDLYPFVLSKSVMEKLRFIQNLIIAAQPKKTRTSRKKMRA